MRKTFFIVVLGFSIAVANSVAAQGGSNSSVGESNKSSYAVAPAQGGGIGPIGGYEGYRRPNPKGGKGPGKDILTNP